MRIEGSSDGRSAWRARGGNDTTSQSGGSKSASTAAGIMPALDPQCAGTVSAGTSRTKSSGGSSRESPRIPPTITCGWVRRMSICDSGTEFRHTRRYKRRTSSCLGRMNSAGSYSTIVGTPRKILERPFHVRPTAASSESLAACGSRTSRCSASMAADRTGRHAR